MASGLDLGKQVGPLPLGAWLAVVAGGLGLAYFINKKGGAGNQPVEEPAQGVLEPGVGTGGQQFIYEPPQTGTATPTTFETNDQWGRAAILYLLSEGKNPNTSTLAIAKYIGEQSLTNEEQALVGLAIAKLGPPPYLPVNPPAPPTTDPPTTNPPPPPTTTPLTAPTGVKEWGSGPFAHVVALTWTPVSGASYYRVYREGVAYNVGSSEDNKIQIGGLTKGKVYRFRVRAVRVKAGVDELGPPSAWYTARKLKG